MKDLSNENIIQFEKNGVSYLQFRKLNEYNKYIRHAYSLGKELNYKTRAGNGNLSENEIEKAILAYEKLCKNIDIEPINIVKANQKHTANVKVAREKINKDKMDLFEDYYKETDGLVTNTPNLALTTTSADCISLLFYDPVKNVIANTHSGWRGTAQKISVNTVRKMFEGFKCEPKDIICCICPSIRKCHFEVDEDVKDIFENEFPSLMQMKEIVEKNEKTNKWHIDTVLINKLILEEVGLKPENIIDSKICTICNSDVLHSARVEKPNYGLNTAIIEKI